MSVLSWAEFYTQTRKWSVIPLTAPVPEHEFFDGKRPLLKTWMKYTEEIPDLETIRWWFKDQDPSPNIGVVTGRVSNLCVVDIDDELSYQEMLEHFPWMSKTYTVKTSKGYHVYVIPSSFPRTQTFRLNGNLHHVKLDRSYVVAPPSIHLSGVKYTHYISSFGYVLNMDDFFKELHDFAEFEDQKERSANWASELCQPISQGGRNDSAAKMCGLLIRKFPYDEGLVLGLMKAWNLMYCDPPLSQSERERLVMYMVRRYQSD